MSVAVTCFLTVIVPLVTKWGEICWSCYKSKVEKMEMRIASCFKTYFLIQDSFTHITHYVPVKGIFLNIIFEIL